MLVNVTTVYLLSLLTGANEVCVHIICIHYYSLNIDTLKQISIVSPPFLCVEEFHHALSQLPSNTFVDFR